MATKVRLYHPETGDPSPELWPLDAVDWQANGWLTAPPSGPAPVEEEPQPEPAPATPRRRRSSPAAS